MAVLRWLIIAILLLGDLLSPFPMLFLHRSGAAGAMAFALLLAVSMVAFLAAAVQGLRLRYPPPHGLHFPDAGMWRIMLGGSIPVLVFSACWWILFLHAGPLVSDAGWMQGMAGWQKYFYVLLFAPITEEAAYRAWLLGPQWNGRTLPLRLFVACFGFAWGHRRRGSSTVRKEPDASYPTNFKTSANKLLAKCIATHTHKLRVRNHKKVTTQEKAR